MKPIVITIALITAVLPKSDNIADCAIHVSQAVENKHDTSVADINPLIEAIIYIESRGNDSAIGDNGLAVGCLQIHPICIREANRIIGFDSFCLNDRYNRQQSINVFKTIKKRYSNKSNEAIARNWNGGPLGYKKKSTIKYWNKVQTRLQNKYE